MIYLLGFIGLLCGGLLFIVMAFTEQDWTLASRIFAIFCGLLFLTIPALGIGAAIAEYKEKRRKKQIQKNYDKQVSEPRQIDKDQQARREKTEARLRDMDNGIVREEKPVKSSIPDAKDSTPFESFLRKFREDYNLFFTDYILRENSALQYDATQLFWNVLALQKKRLAKLNLTMSFRSVRKALSGIAPVSERDYFDGKYNVKEVSEYIEETTSISRDKAVLYNITDRKVGQYVLTSAKQVGKENIICPNCGANTTRENLIDGCDFCGTKFTVEDLKQKISSFRLRDDYEIRYEEYRQRRAQYNKNVFWGQFAVYFLLTMAVYVIGFFTGDMADTTAASNPLEYFLVAPLAASFAAGAFAYLGLCMFWITIFPIIQMKQSVTYYNKRRLDKMKNQDQKDRRMQEQIRQYDPLFSVAGFYSGLNNKLATIHYADTKEGVNAFFEKDIAGVENMYKDVVSMDMSEVSIKDYKVENGLQKIHVETALDLLIDKDRRIAKRKETLRMTLIKDAKCKTQEVCGPAVFKCKGCGNSLALENGKTCPSCGRMIDFKQFDWVIRSYEIC